MLVCWEWLSEYVDLSVEPDEMALKFAMSGLNHESTQTVGRDLVLDLEVTSNRGDCLGHLGVAREAAVLLAGDLRVPLPNPAVGKAAAAGSIQVDNLFVEGCPQYTVRIIRGVQVGPSPAWLVRRLGAVGINSVNNVVDVTNYVMMECGQPLHAFDLKHIRGGKIIVRRAAPKEQFVAIDHKTYSLDPDMVVIADAERAVALGGVMGGEESEVSASTTDLLIEAARFTPLLIRRAARVLKLHSPSSYRFERLPDPAGLEWASLRCCELILQLAGGELSEGVVSGGLEAPPREAITFRLNQIPRVLGIDVPNNRVQEILSALGCAVEVAKAPPAALRVVPPSWRNDLQREIDLVEEVARIHGYEEIPENVAVPIGVASPRPKDICLLRVRHVLSAYGIDEAMTPSVVGERLEQCGSLWSQASLLAVETPLLVGAKLLRSSLLPSLLEARYTNQSQANIHAQLYEVAGIYLPGSSPNALPHEQCTLGLVTDGDLRLAKGVVEEIIAQVAGATASVSWQRIEHPFFEADSGLRVQVAGNVLGFVGMVSRQVRQTLSLDHPVAAAELNVDLLTQTLEAIKTAQPVSAFPAISRDLNFVVDEQLTWAELSAKCSEQGGEFLQSVQYCETYRDTQKDGAGKKRILLSLYFQSLQRTLTGDEVDAAVQSIIAACSQSFDATLLG